MREKWKTALMVLGVTLGGLFVLVVTYLSYFAVTILIESLFYGTNPQAVPMDVIRRGFALTIGFLYLIIDRFRWPDALKASLMMGPASMILITIILQFYRNMPLALSLCAILIGCIVFVLYKQKRPWIFTYSLALSVLIALFYGWPR